MSLYSYKASDRDGKIISGRQKALSDDDLIFILRDNGLFCTEYSLVKEKQPRARYKFKTKKLSIFCRQLSAMLTSGVNLVRAIHILMNQEENREARKVLREIYDELQRGNAFSDALLHKPGTFPPLFISMVAAGEASGNLDIIMQRVADHYAKEAKLKNSISSAMVYPIILCFGMILVIFVIFVAVLPMFEELFEGVEEIPTFTAFLMNTSKVFKEYWPFIALGLAAIVGIIAFLIHTPKIRFLYDRIKCRMPKIGKLISTIYTARFARTMSNLFASGMQMVDCIEKSVDTLNNKYISKLFIDVVEDVKKGDSLSVSIAKTKVFENIFVSSIYIGEESGRIDEILEKNADYYDEEADSAVKKLVSLIEPVIIIIIGILVMMVLAGVFTGLFASYQTI